jgi:tetratricopeptide (TPR) repeat protein
MATASGGRWFYAQGNQRLGPVELDRLVDLIATGRLPATTLVWRHGLGEWKPAGSLRELADHLPPPLPGGSARPVTAAAPAPTLADTPRIAELRRRLEDEAQWRAFPQLVDELRKQKRLDEALQVCRAGLQKHPDYRLARIALAHVLMDQGELAPAQLELQTVLDGAPENVVAGRLLGECLEIQGDPQAALLAYKATMVFAPRDPLLLGRVRALGGEPAASEVEEPGAAEPESEAAEQPATPAATAEAPLPGVAEREEDSRPIPLVSADDEFELERPGSAARVVKAKALPAQAPPPFGAEDPSYWPTRSLAENDVPDLLHALHQRRWSGTLALAYMGQVKSIMVHDGRPIFASSSKDDRLGDLLLRRGRISLQQYLDASQAVTRGKRLGSILVEQGALEPADLVSVVLEHTQEVIYSVFRWAEGFYRLRDGLDGEETITLDMTTPDIILEGVRRVEAWSQIERGIGGIEARYERVAEWERQAEQMTLTPETRALLAEHQGVKSVREICQQASMLSDFELCRTVWAFRVIGVLRAVPPEIAPSGPPA